MKQFHKICLTILLLTGSIGTLFAQKGNFWRMVDEASIGKNLFAQSKKPTAYKIFQLNDVAFRNFVFQAPSEKNVQVTRSSFVVAFPNEEGIVEEYRIVDAPVMEEGLAIKYPGIRSYAGKGINNPASSIRFSVSQQGVNAVVFTPGKSSVYIDKLEEQYYRVVARKDAPDFRSDFRCLTEDVPSPGNANAGRLSNADDAKLRIYRLAMMSAGEFSQHFLTGLETTDAERKANVLAAQNAHMTRANAVFERDFGLRLVLIANNDLIIYLNPGTDPIGNPNSPVGTTVQSTIDAQIGAANYDIGHLQSKGSDNGNAGCIGCVCQNGFKGRAWTVYQNPSLLEFFVIDYLTHEMGHQLGANHTFSFQLEGTGVNMEPGSGSTIMGYAGITGGTDIQAHSDEFFHSKSIEQVTNFIKGTLGNSCANVTNTGNNTPTANAGQDYIIPRSTPFRLTGVGTDADASDVLTYNWEQIDNRTGGFSSIPVSTATNGALFRAYLPTTNPQRIFPRLSDILSGTNQNQWEVLPSVARTLNFRFIVKDNRPTAGNNESDDVALTVSGTSGPFLVTAPNTAVSWQATSTQTVTWSVNGTDGAPINCGFVNIKLSTDGGQTFPITLAANTANDGTENVIIPNVISNTARIMVESVGNIFFDICNTNFIITAPPSGFTFNAPATTNISCGGAATATATLGTTSNGGFNTPINLSATSSPAGTTVSFSPNPLTPGNNTTVTLNNANTLAPGSYTVSVSGVAGSNTQNVDLTFVVQPGTAPAINTQPSAVDVCAGGSANFSVSVAGSGLSYQWQLSTDGGATWNNITGATSASYNIASTDASQNNHRFRVIISTLCASATSDAAVLTVNSAPSISQGPADAAVCTNNDITFNVVANGTALNYQWQSSTDGGATWNNISGANASSYTITGVTIGLDGTRYRVIVDGACPSPVTSGAAILTVTTAVNITAQPVSQVVCSGADATFTVAGSGTGIVYQWQVSTDGGATWTNIPTFPNPTLTVAAVTIAQNGYQYRAILTNSTCTTPTVSDAVTLTVNSLPAVTTQPTSVTLCAGSNHTFTAAGTGTGINYQWQVSTDGGATFTNIPGETNPTLSLTNIAASSNNNQYHLVIGGVCTPDAVSDNVTLTVISPVTVTAQPANTAVCVGSNTSFTAAGSGTGVIYQWQVSTDGGATWTDISGATAATLSINNAQTADNGNRYRVLMSNATCTTPATSDAATLTVNALPNVTANAAQTNVCTGTAVQLTASGAVNYNWTPGNLSGDVVTVNPTVDPNNPGQPLVNTYTVTGTDANGCVSTANISVTADPLPVVTLTANPPQTRVHPGITVLLKATVTPAANYAFTWRKNGVLISNSTDSLRVGVADMGDYTVTANVIGATCENTSDVVSVRDSASTTLFIYPNPNNGQFTVAYHNPGGVRYDNPEGLIRSRTLTVYDAKGARVYSKRLTAAETYELIRVNLTPASAGTYFVELRDASGERLASGKVLVQY